MVDKLDPKLREEIVEEAENLCKICGRWCNPGEPHHVVKISEEPLLRNCKTNIWWLCKECHGETETNPGFNHKLQKILQDKYYQMFDINKKYGPYEVIKIVGIPEKDMEKAMNKGMIKTCKYSILGEDVIRFLMGGSLKND